MFHISTLRCIIGFQSVFHWAKDCPEKRNAVQMTECDPDEVEDCNVTLLTKEVPSTNEKNSSLVQKRNTLEIRCSIKEDRWSHGMAAAIRRKAS